MFKEVVRLMNNKTHLSIQGLNQIINIKASMNLGLSDFLNYELAIPPDRKTRDAAAPNLYLSPKAGKTNY